MDKGQELRDQFRSLLVTQGVFDRAIRPCGAALSLSHAYALLELYISSKPMTVTELASRLQIDRTSVSRLCQRMEELGELERAKHPGDKRAKALRLTKRGESLAKYVDEASTLHFGKVIEILGDDVNDVLAGIHKLEQAFQKVSKAKGGDQR